MSGIRYDDRPEDGCENPPIETEQPVAELVIKGNRAERRRLLLALQGESDATYDVEVLHEQLLEQEEFDPLRDDDTGGVTSYVITPKSNGENTEAD